MFPAFLLGLLGSFHCAAMCAPIMLSIKWQGVKSLTTLRNKLLYQVGRIFTYILIGLLFYAFGSSDTLASFQKLTSIFIGVVLIAGVVFKNKISGISNKLILKIFSSLQKALSPFTRIKGPAGSLSSGMLNGLLPCGLVYLAAFTAVLQPSLVDSATYMFFFGLGTLPVLIAVMAGTRIAGKQVKLITTKLTPIFIVVLGAFFLVRGMELGIPYLSPILELSTDSTSVCEPAL